MKSSKIIIAFFIVFFVAPVGEAAIYSYRDEKGRLFLTDSPPNSKYQIVVTSRKNRAGPDDPNAPAQAVSEMVPQKVLLPNDETYSPYINRAAKATAVDPYLIKAIIKVESDFDPRVLSSKGAQGLMQLIPSTARLVGCKDAFDPADNIMGGTRYLKMMLERFGGQLDLALASYNAGPGRVDQYNGIPPFRETRNYVKKVKHYFHLFRSGAGLSTREKVVKKVVKTIPVAPSALSQKLTSAYDIFCKNDIEGAIRAYQGILNVYPKNTQALYNLACLLDQERRYEEAIETHLTALKQDPFLDKAIYNLAIIYERLGYHSEAIKAWKRFMQTAKDEEKMLMAERYIRELEEYVALNP